MDQTTFQKQLINRYVKNLATLDELEVIDYLIAEGTLDDLLMLNMQENWEIEEAAFAAEVNLVRPPVPKLKLWSRAAILVAASIAIMVVGLYLFKFSGIGRSAGDKESLVGEIAPGKNAATLTLPNGKSIILNGAKTGVVIDVSKVVYNDGTELTEASQKGMQIISTPKGGTYQVYLPDGSRVWLNAASSLKFRTTLATEPQRRVELNGEAYFEVVHNKRSPFIVTTNQQEVQVLGTHFNINSYTNELVTKTTLLEGSVSVKPIGKAEQLDQIKNSIVLKPGQQSVVNSQTLKIVQLNAENEIDWKEGDFVLENEMLESIMRKIARWYDVDIVYAKDAPLDLPLSGAVSRSKNITSVLGLIESTGKVHFNIKGKTITVSR
ncbi:FecR family protein [Pedobacter hiemivivus]|uniref:DUF4974 domain-containing protein n=1 Tax=Pedobacter hiemivivus TaxID=2530454 RepID=A0A4R0NKY5_9SPHI|nr:FecR domain-containing protein [Pedobacter hiemivivus]TCC99654.1 DUF4974 domain-containing protein [Pedobacter hiemivivus]